MRMLLLVTILSLSVDAFAQRFPRRGPGPGRGIVVSVRGQGYFPDHATANGVCISKGYGDAVGYTQWRQAGDQIQGMRSYDGSAFFQSHVWRGGMALDEVSCRYRGGQGPSAQISVRGQGYYPDDLTAQAICVFNRYRGTTGFTQWQQAGDQIEGQRSYDGRPYFSRAVWRGGMAIDVVNCQ